MRIKKFILAFTLVSFFSIDAQNLIPNDKFALLKGNVTNFKGKVLAQEIIIFCNDKTKEMVNAVTDGKGNFEALIPVDATYSLKYKTFTSDEDYTKMKVPADADAIYNVKIKIDPPREIILSDVFFDTGKSTLKPSSFKSLNNLAEVLMIKNSMIIEIQGHTDNIGTEAANLKLSEARASEVKRYLISKGVKAEMVKSKGFGSTQPIADNDNETGRAQNRRTSLKVIKE